MKADAYGHGIELLMSVLLSSMCPVLALPVMLKPLMVRKSGYQGRLLRRRAATRPRNPKCCFLKYGGVVGEL